MKFPSINWRDVHIKYKYLAISPYGEARLYQNKPYAYQNTVHKNWYWRNGGDVVDATAFASFSHGGVPWQESLIGRIEDDE